MTYKVKNSKYTLQLHYTLEGDSSNISIANGKFANEVDLDELISFIELKLKNTKEEYFGAEMSDEFGVNVPDSDPKDISRNKSRFIELAGDIEDLIVDIYGIESEMYYHFRAILENWEKDT